MGKNLYVVYFIKFTCFILPFICSYTWSNFLLVMKLCKILSLVWHFYSIFQKQNVKVSAFWAPLRFLRFSAQCSLSLSLYVWFLPGKSRESMGKPTCSPPPWIFRQYDGKEQWNQNPDNRQKVLTIWLVWLFNLEHMILYISVYKLLLFIWKIYI